MQFRLVFLLVIIALLASTAAVAQSGMLDLDNLWRRGQFTLAREIINARQLAGQDDLDFLAQAARCSEEMHDHTAAAGFYADYAALLAGDSEAYREARFHEWANRWAACGGDETAPWLVAAREEVASLLSDTRLRLGSERRLALELEFLLDSLTGDTVLPSTELREDYPASRVVLQAAKAAADRVAVEPDDNRRMELISAFLADYPGNHWIHFVYRYRLYTAWRLRDAGLLLSSADDYLAAAPDQPASLGAVSRYFFDADVEFDRGLEFARRSVELSETALGIDGSLASLQHLQEQTTGLPLQPGYLPPSPRGLFLEYLGSRYNLARYAVAGGNHAAALGLVTPVITLDPYTPDEDYTLAPFLLLQGQALAGQEHYAAAYRSFLAAAIAGDSRNRYARLAQQQLAAVEEHLGKTEIRVIRDDAIPPELAAIALPHFTDVTTELGLTGARGQRVAWGDIDLDGDQDMLVNGNRLYRNDLDLDMPGTGFTAVSKLWGLGGKTTGGVFGDFDNDGDLDLYATGHGHRGDRLWRNDIVNRTGVPAMRMVDITAVAGAPTDDYPSEGAAWVDYDADGYLDLYVGNYELARQDDDPATTGTPDAVYHNIAGTHFVSPPLQQLGFLTPFDADYACRGAVCAADFDNDSDQDIFIGNYRLQENFLWRNSGDSTLLNAARLLGVAGNPVESWWGHSTGAAWGDIDNDADLDLFIANVAHPRYSYISDQSQLLLNTPGLLGPQFTDERAARGIHSEETHACPVFFDANNDGWLDLFITSMYDGRPSFLYLNDGTGYFHDVTFLTSARVLGGFGAAWADYDGDGDLDLAVGRGTGSVVLLRNDSPPSGWLSVNCIGSMAPGSDTVASNRTAIGARIEIEYSGMRQIREIQSGSGTGCGNQLAAHFGLGGYTGPVAVRVRFPSGIVVTEAVEAAPRAIVVNEAAAGVPPLDEAPAAALDDEPPEDAPADAVAAALSEADDPAGLNRTSGSRSGAD